MEKNDILSGFIVLDRQSVDELDAVLWQMEHQKSGARLVWLERAEENKTFGIAFQTQPWDDTGIFHILEHSVLCGSERYPVKEPFVELMKSSLNTFLNAMTFPDRTFYPVSSRNDQDFINLLRVYMDAVLHPLLHSRPEIFGQEGWHYELDEDGAPFCKGVVFNEMKGTFASPDALLEREMTRCLFPDTCYRFVSGGDPEHIPELTYEAFTAAHRRLYHPSNSYIFLDGRLNIGEILAILDSEYLSGYERRPAPGAIPLQKPVDGGLSIVRYELSPQETPEGRSKLADGFVACTGRDREALTAIHGGVKRNIVADSATAELDVRVPIGVDHQTVIDRVEKIIRDSRIEGVHATYDNPRGGNYVSIHDPVVAVAKSCVKELLGIDLVAAYQWASSDTRYFREAGISTIQYGPSNTKGIHNYNETVNTADIVTACKVYAAMILELLQ